jgi:hypothetical protein
MSELVVNNPLILVLTFLFMHLQEGNGDISVSAQFSRKTSGVSLRTGLWCFASSLRGACRAPAGYRSLTRGQGITPGESFAATESIR